MIAILAKTLQHFTQHLQENGLQASRCFWANSFEACRRNEITDVRIDRSCEGSASQMELFQYAKTRKVR